MNETIVHTNEYRQDGQEARRQRGLVLAATRKIRRKANAWIVPSQRDANDQYIVDGDTCTCPDHTTRGVRCKHMYAVEYVLQRETRSDGTVTETESVKVTRVTYRQDWRAYNAAQTEEKTRFTALLSELCQTVPQPEQTKGRPRLPLADMVFASAFKVYTGFSSRRFTSDLRDAQANGHVASAPHFNSVTNYLASPALTPILQGLIATSSLPLRAVETDFAVDSSGFGTSRFVRWYTKKYGREQDNREWVKVHVMCGVQTKIVTSVEVSNWAANDSPFFVPLVNATAANFPIAEVSADKAYISRRNVAAVAQVGATPYIPFKINSTLDPSDNSDWTKMSICSP
ncbi:MAG TPA: transposase [Dehalococcoidia bacterium]|nr:transposase [Dehalococcoidia bacterium]